ncbi:MAG: DUF6790 family protein [Acidimicrobiia bacterium]
MLGDFLAKAHNPSGSESYAAAASWFIMEWILMIVAAAVHIVVDRRRHPDRRGTRRTVELALIWLLAFGGFWAIFSGVGHISGMSDQLAESIGYTPSMFQWEIGWADIGIGVLGLVCIWRRDSWMTAAVVMLSISYLGDAIGHIMQWVEHDNTEPDNVWAIPSDILAPLLAIVLLIWYRRMSPAGRSVGEPSPAV